MVEPKASLYHSPPGFYPNPEKVENVRRASLSRNSIPAVLAPSYLSSFPAVPPKEDDKEDDDNECDVHYEDSF